MKIGLVTAHYPPEFSGGTEVVVRAQALELARRGHEVQVFSGSDRSVEELAAEDARTAGALEAGSSAPGCAERHASVDGIPVTWFHRRAHETYDLALARLELREALDHATAHMDLLHVHHWSTLHRELVRESARRVPIVVTLHDHFASCARFFRASPVEGVACPTRGSVEPCVRCIRGHAAGISEATLEMALVERQSALEAELAAASAVIAPSGAHLAALRASMRLPEDRVQVIEHGLSQPWARACERSAERSVPAYDGRRPLVVLHFGHRSRAKGTLDLVRAAALLPPRSVEVWFSGRELEPGLDRELAREAGATRLVFQAPFGDEGPVELARRADLAAFPSRLYESYGLVLDEALALGLPVWISDRGAPPERLRAIAALDASPSRSLPGRVLPAEDPRAWADALAELVRAPAMLDESRSAIPRRLRSAADAAAELSDLYRELLRAGRPRPIPRTHAA